MYKVVIILSVLVTLIVISNKIFLGSFFVSPAQFKIYILLSLVLVVLAILDHYRKK